MAWRTLTLSCAVSVLLACGGHGPEPLPSALTWVTVPPSDPRLQYTGRVDVSAASAVFSYPGVSLEVRFWGDALELLLNEQGPDDARTTNYYQVTLDGQAPVKLAVRASQTVYAIGRNLPLGEHTVGLIKLTESDVGRSELRGLRLHGRLLEPPARPGSRIEFIGDSITCGYGKDFNDRGDTRVHYLAFTPQTGPYGEDWHPSAATHEAMATRLTELIRSLR